MTTSILHAITTTMDEDLKSWRHHLHQHPELAYEEHQTSTYIANLLESFGYQPTIGLGKTGVVATLDRGDGPAIGLRADMDALPIFEKTGLSYASKHEGKMHACGHDGHMTMLLGAAKYLAATETPPGKIHFIFQPAEEGFAGAQAMIEDGLFDKFPVDQIFGLHNWPGLPEGIFAARPGPQMAGYDTFEIHIEGMGGHAAMPHLCNDVLTAASALHMQCQTIVSRSIDPIDSAVVSVTSMQGGDAWNVIPPCVTLKGCTRYLNPLVQDIIEQRMHEVAEGVAKSFSVKVSLHYSRCYPATINDSDAVDIALNAAKHTTGENPLRNEPPSLASEDFSYMLHEKKGCFVWLGAGSTEGGCLLHNPCYDFNDAILSKGVAFWATLANNFLLRSH